MLKNKFLNQFNISSLIGFSASVAIIILILASSCTKRECRGSIARPLVRVRLKKEFIGNTGAILYIKDTFLRVTSIKGVGSLNDSILYIKPENSKDSLNILSLPLSPIVDLTTYIIMWKDTNTLKPTYYIDTLRFKYVSYQVQTSELCGFQKYFKDLEALPTPKIPNKKGFQEINITKTTVNLVNDTIHAFVYLQQ